MQGRKELRLLGFWNSQRGKPHPMVKYNYQNEGNIGTGNAQCNIDDATVSEDMDVQSRREGGVRAGGVLAQLYNRLTDATTKSREPTSSVPANVTALMTSAGNTSDISQSQEQASQPLAAQSEERISYFTPPYYVCSGGATTMLNAHRIHHYIRGIIHRKASSVSDARDIHRGGFSVPHLLLHDVSVQDAQQIDIADECFHTLGNGFFTYKC